MMSFRAGSGFLHAGRAFVLNIFFSSLSGCCCCCPLVFGRLLYIYIYFLFFLRSIRMLCKRGERESISALQMFPRFIKDATLRLFSFLFRHARRETKPKTKRPPNGRGGGGEYPNPISLEKWWGIFQLADECLLYREREEKRATRTPEIENKYIYWRENLKKKKTGRGTHNNVTKNIFILKDFERDKSAGIEWIREPGSAFTTDHKWDSFVVVELISRKSFILLKKIYIVSPPQVRLLWTAFL